MQTTLDDPRLKRPLSQLQATYSAYKHQAIKEWDLTGSRFDHLLEAIYVAARCAGPQEFQRYVEVKLLKSYQNEITPEIFNDELAKQKEKLPFLEAVFIPKEDKATPKINLAELGIIKRKGIRANGNE
jgi:thiamine pyrophosphokinase